MNTSVFTLNPRVIAVLMLTATISFVSCDKKESDPPTTPTVPTNPTPTSPKNPSINFSGGKGTLSAVITRTFQTVPIVGEIETDFGVAAAAFYDDPASGTFMEAGTVSCNTNVLTKQTNNTYAFTPTAGNASGIDFAANDVTWEVSGAGTVPTISETFTNNFPDVKKITSATEITRANGYTLECESVSFADSVLYMVGGIYHTHSASNGTSYTFTSDELNTLAAGSNFVQVTAYNFVSKVTSGETYYYVKETVITKSVTLK